ncbi:MAG: hypothetical protein MHMPM18_002921 [Marteilia pararefringens]
MESSNVTRVAQISRRIEKIHEEALAESKVMQKKLQQFAKEFKGKLGGDTKLEERMFGDNALEIVRRFNDSRNCGDRDVEGRSKRGEIDVKFIDPHVLLDEIEDFEKKINGNVNNEWICDDYKDKADSQNQEKEYFDKIKRKIEHKKRARIEQEKALSFLADLMEDRIIEEGVFLEIDIFSDFSY